MSGVSPLRSWRPALRSDFPASQCLGSILWWRNLQVPLTCVLLIEHPTETDDEALRLRPRITGRTEVPRVRLSLCRDDDIRGPGRVCGVSSEPESDEAVSTGRDGSLHLAQWGASTHRGQG